MARRTRVDACGDGDSPRFIAQTLEDARTTESNGRQKWKSGFAVVVQSVVASRETEPVCGGPQRHGCVAIWRVPSEVREMRRQELGLNQNTSLIEALLSESFESLFGLIENPSYGSGV